MDRAARLPERTPGVAALDGQDLRHDRCGDLLGLLGAQVQACGRMEAPAVGIGQEEAFASEVVVIQQREQQVDARYAELGLKACAGQPV